MSRNAVLNQKDSGEYSGTGKGIKRKSPDGNGAVSIKADDKFPDMGSDLWTAHRISQGTPDLAAYSSVHQRAAQMGCSPPRLFSQISSPRPTFGYQQIFL